MSAAAATQTRTHNTTAEGQIKLANALIAELAPINIDFATQVWGDLKSAWAKNECSYKFVSGHIARMIEAKQTSRKLAESTVRRSPVPSGRYAVTGADGTTKFYRVVNEDGRITLFCYASDTQHLVSSWKSVTTILAQIASDGLKTASVRFGVELGKCYECGRALTDADSRAAGIGPICAGK